MSINLKNEMKPPVSYYGGKQNMSNHIINLIPKHTTYIEPFFGGGAVFFAKKKSHVEIINDLNNYVMNFYDICKNKYTFKQLKHLIKFTCVHKAEHTKARFIAKNLDMYSKIEQAWSFFVNANMGFSATINKGFGYAIKSHSQSRKILNKLINFNEIYYERLKGVTIFNIDALEIIKKFDHEEAFFYIDPPYFNSDCGHYKGYSINDFEDLLKLLSKIKGKFLLSSYPSEILEKYVNEFNWNSDGIEKVLSVTSKKNTQKRKSNSLPQIKL